MAEATLLVAGTAVLAEVTLSAEAALVQGTRRVHPRAGMLPVLQFLLAASIEGVTVRALAGARGATA
jgi:hypothetical protein